MLDKLRQDKGQTLVESIIAISIAVVGLLGVFSLVTRSLSLNRVVADRYIASNLAAEGVEIVKNLIDNNILSQRPWNQGLNPGEYEIDYNDNSLQTSLRRSLLFDAGSGLYSYEAGSPTRFTRSVKVDWHGNGDELQVNAMVKWTTRGGGQFEINAEDRFFNWR